MSNFNPNTGAEDSFHNPLSTDAPAGTFGRAEEDSAQNDALAAIEADLASLWTAVLRTANAFAELATAGSGAQATARGNLGLGTAATSAITDFDPTGTAASAVAAIPADAAAGTPSLRSLGTGANNAMAGADARVIAAGRNVYTTSGPQALAAGDEAHGMWPLSLPAPSTGFRARVVNTNAFALPVTAAGGGVFVGTTTGGGAGSSVYMVPKYSAVDIGCDGSNWHAINQSIYVFSPEQFGAYCDGQVVQDGQITGGSSTLACPVSTPFAQTDPGKTVVISAPTAAVTALNGNSGPGVVVASGASITSVTLATVPAAIVNGDQILLQKPIYGQKPLKLIVTATQSQAQSATQVTITVSGKATTGLQTSGMTAQDVGQSGSSSNPGANAWVPSTTTITGYTNSGTVTLAMSPSYTATGVKITFGHVDGPALVAAVNAALAQPLGAAVQFSEGIYLTDRSISTPAANTPGNAPWIALFGKGMNASSVVAVASFGGHVFAPNMSHSVRGVTFDANQLAGGAYQHSTMYVNQASVSGYNKGNGGGIGSANGGWMIAGWQPSYAYVVGQTVQPMASPTGYYWTCTTAGTSSAGEPTAAAWTNVTAPGNSGANTVNTSTNGTPNGTQVTDGSVVWICSGYWTDPVSGAVLTPSTLVFSQPQTTGPQPGLGNQTASFTNGHTFAGPSTQFPNPPITCGGGETMNGAGPPRYRLGVQLGPNPTQIGRPCALTDTMASVNRNNAGHTVSVLMESQTAQSTAGGQFAIASALSASTQSPTFTVTGGNSTGQLVYNTAYTTLSITGLNDSIPGGTPLVITDTAGNTFTFTTSGRTASGATTINGSGSTPTSSSGWVTGSSFVIGYLLTGLSTPTMSTAGSTFVVYDSAGTHTALFTTVSAITAGTQWVQVTPLTIPAGWTSGAPYSAYTGARVSWGSALGTVDRVDVDEVRGCNVPATSGGHCFQFNDGPLGSSLMSNNVRATNCVAGPSYSTINEAFSMLAHDYFVSNLKVEGCVGRVGPMFYACDYGAINNVLVDLSSSAATDCGAFDGENGNLNYITVTNYMIYDPFGISQPLLVNAPDVRLVNCSFPGPQPPVVVTGCTRVSSTSLTVTNATGIQVGMSLYDLNHTAYTSGCIVQSITPGSGTTATITVSGGTLNASLPTTDTIAFFTPGSNAHLVCNGYGNSQKLEIVSSTIGSGIEISNPMGQLSIDGHMAIHPASVTGGNPPSCLYIGSGAGPAGPMTSSDSTIWDCGTGGNIAYCTNSSTQLQLNLRGRFTGSAVGSYGGTIANGNVTSTGTVDVLGLELTYDRSSNYTFQPNERSVVTGNCTATIPSGQYPSQRPYRVEVATGATLTVAAPSGVSITSTIAAITGAATTALTGPWIGDIAYDSRNGLFRAMSTAPATTPTQVPPAVLIYQPADPAATSTSASQAAMMGLGNNGLGTQTVSAVAIAGSTITLTVPSTTGYQAGQTVVNIAGMAAAGITGLNGNYVVSAVPSTTTLQVVQAGVTGTYSGTGATVTGGCTFTPLSTGNIRLRIEGMAGNLTAATTVQMTGRYALVGTGAPTNGQTPTVGNTFTPKPVTIAGKNTGEQSSFALLSPKITGLTLNSQYYVDMTLLSGVAADAAEVGGITVTIEEVT